LAGRPHEYRLRQGNRVVERQPVDAGDETELSISSIDKRSGILDEREPDIEGNVIKADLLFGGDKVRF
jgi:hypothetical protein